MAFSCRVSPPTGIETREGLRPPAPLLAAWGTPSLGHGNATVVGKPFMAKLDKIAFLSRGTSDIGAETAKLLQSGGAIAMVTGSSERPVGAAKSIASTIRFSSDVVVRPRRAAT
jgi:hypothetical protein